MYTRLTQNYQCSVAYSNKVCVFISFKDNNGGVSNNIQYRAKLAAFRESVDNNSNREQRPP